MNQHHRPLQEIPHASVVSRLTYSLDRIAGPIFARRVLAPDAACGGSGGGGSPKGVPLPGLQAARQGLGLSQAELADRSGVSEKTISRLERGGRAHYVTLERLARALRVSRKQLLQSPLEPHR